MEKRLFISCVVFVLLSCVVDLRLALVLGLILYLLMTYVTIPSDNIFKMLVATNKPDESDSSSDEEEEEPICIGCKRKIDGTIVKQEVIEVNDD